MNKKFYLFFSFFDRNLFEKVSLFRKKIIDKYYCIKFEANSLSKGIAGIQAPCTLLGLKYVDFQSFSSGPYLRIECIDDYYGQAFSPNLKIGSGVAVGYNCHIGVINEVKIEDNVLIGSNVLITDHSHGKNSIEELHIPPVCRKLFSKGTVEIKKGVWIVDNCSILPGADIGENSVIACNSVVNKVIPPNCIAAGIPAKPIKYLKL